MGSCCAIQYIANAHGSYDIYRVALPSGAAQQLTPDQRYEVSPAETPDRARVLYVRLDHHWVDHEIVSIAAHGGDARVIASDSDSFDYHYGRTFGPPIIAPGEATLLFRSHRSGWINYWAAPLAGGAPRHFCPQAADQSGATWSPDGRTLAFVATDNGTLALWLCGADGSDLRVLVRPEQGVCLAPAWSPDGATIALYILGPTEPQDLWLVNVADGALTRLTDSLPVGYSAPEYLSRGPRTSW